MTTKNIRTLKDKVFKLREEKLSKLLVKPEDMQGLEMRAATLSEGRVGLTYLGGGDEITLTTYAIMPGGSVHSIQISGERHIGRFLRYMDVYNNVNLEGKAVTLYVAPYPSKGPVYGLKRNEE